MPFQKMPDDTLASLSILRYCKVRNIGVELLLATLASGLDSLILRSVYICTIFPQFFILHKPPSSGADKSRFWPNRALWGRSMKLGTIMV